MKKNRLAIGLLSVILFFPCIACSGGNDGSRINLSGNWEIISDNACNRDLPVANKTGSRSVTLPGSWKHLLRREKELTSCLVLQKNVVIPANLIGKPLEISLGKIGVSDETYFNGIKIGAMGKIPDEKNLMDYRFRWLRTRKYFIPDNLVKFGGENSISIKVFSHVINGINGNLFIGKKNESAIWGDTPTSYINIYTIVLNILLSIIFILLLEVHKKRKLILLQAMVIISVITVYLFLMGFSEVHGHFRYRAILLAGNSGYFFYLLSVMEFLETWNRRMAFFSFLALAAVETLILLSPDTLSIVFVGGTSTLVLNLLYLTFYSAIFFVALAKNFRRYGVLILAAIPLMITAVQAYYDLFSFEIYRVPELFFIHVTISLLGAIVVILLDLGGLKDEAENLSSALARKSRLVKNLKRSLRHTESTDEPKDKIYQIMQYLDEHFRERYDRRALSQKFDINEDYIGQLFKKTTGTNISNYINMRRIETAKKLLLETDSKIIDIGYHVGFETLVHFHRQFKKSTGMTPQEFRKTVVLTGPK